MGAPSTTALRVDTVQSGLPRLSQAGFSFSRFRRYFKDTQSLLGAFFASESHGKISRWKCLFRRISKPIVEVSLLPNIGMKGLSVCGQGPPFT